MGYTILPMRKFVAPEIIFGSGALELAGQYAYNLSGRKVLLVCDSGIKRAGWSQRVIQSLAEAGLRVIDFDRISENPQAGEVMAGAEVYHKEGCDLIVAVGGGSPLDCAKTIGAVAANRCHVLDLEGVDMVPVPGPPLICVPTTTSAADVSQFAIISDDDKKRKLSIISKYLVPDVSLIDPLTQTTLSKRQTAITGMDALSHAFESYISNASSPLTDLCALEAARLIFSNLPLAYEDPLRLQYREMMMLGGMYAGLAFSNASLGLVHAMAHSIGGFYNTSHGEITAALLEAVVEFNYPAAPEKYDALEKAISGKDGGPGVETLVSELKDLRHLLGTDHGLRHLGVKEEDIPALSRSTLKDPSLATNPRHVTLKDVEGLYGRAL